MGRGRCLNQTGMNRRQDVRTHPFILCIPIYIIIPPISSRTDKKPDLDPGIPAVILVVAIFDLGAT